MPTQRVLTYLFLSLVVLVQYPLWLGKGGWLRVWDLDRQLAAQKQVNDDLKRRNTGLDAEVRDLKNGLGAIEERARFELGMVKNDEVFFEVLENTAPAPVGAGNQPAPAAAPAAAPPAVAASSGAAPTPPAPTAR
jgi:cell division protein FtsB